MDNKNSFEKFVEIVTSNANTSIKIGDILTILQVIVKSIEEDKEMDTETANTIIMEIISGLAIRLEFDKASELLDDCINDLKDSAA